MTRGHKKSRDHSRGSEGGQTTLDFSPIRFLAKPLPASHDAGLDEREQAGLLTSRSSYSASLTNRDGQWVSWRFVTRYSGATARDLHPLPYSPQTSDLRHLFT
jgi:hypothetical protein